MAKPIVFHPVYARLTGSLQAGLMLSHAVAQPAAGFYKNAEEWEDESTLTYSNQKTGRKRLTEVSNGAALPFWSETLKGIPARLYFVVDVPALNDCVILFMQAEKALRCK